MFAPDPGYISKEVSDASSSTQPKLTRKKTNLEEEEDEEMEDLQQDNRNQYRKPKPQLQVGISSQQRHDEAAMPSDSESGSDDEEQADEEEDEEPEIPEMLVPNRSRRANAGRKMHDLINQQLEEGDKDEFYNKIYGGFHEMDQDEDFQSPPHSSGEELEEVDSDFDKSEEEQAEEDEGQNNRVDEVERAEQRRKKQKQKQLLERNKNWAIARINKISVPENSCDAKTQRQRLEEAKKTVELNIASLKRFEEFELERKKRQAKNAPKTKLEGQRIKEVMTADGKHLLILPEIPPKEQLFPRPARREFRVCAVTSRPAHYIDPLTKLPYANSAAFRLIRDKYKQFLAEIEHDDHCPASTSGGVLTSASNAYGGFTRQLTSAKQRKLAEQPQTSADE